MRTKQLLAVACLFAVASGCAGRPNRTTTSASIQSHVSGRITGADTRLPLSGASVSFFKADGSIEGGSSFTGADGSYSHELPAGSYQVLVNSATETKPLGWNGYAPVWTYGDLTGARKATVTVAPGEATTYDQALPPLRNCTGRVMAPSRSQPSAGGNVSATPFGAVGVLASLPVPATGDYTFPLPDGEWQLQFDIPGYRQGITSKFSVSGSPVAIPDLTLDPA